MLINKFLSKTNHLKLFCYSFWKQDRKECKQSCQRMWQAKATLWESFQDSRECQSRNRASLRETRVLQGKRIAIKNLVLNKMQSLVNFFAISFVYNVSLKANQISSWLMRHLWKVCHKSLRKWSSYSNLWRTIPHSIQKTLNKQQKEYPITLT